MDEYGMNRVALDPLYEREVAARRGELRGLVAHVSAYVVVCGGLAAVNLLTSPDYLWFLWPVFGWGIGVASHVTGALGMGAPHGGCHRRGPTQAVSTGPWIADRPPLIAEWRRPAHWRRVSDSDAAPGGVSSRRLRRVNRPHAQ